MGIHPESSVVNPHGESWELKNLFLADASILPTATGVNPMITISATAFSIAQHIKKRLGDYSSKL